VQLYENSGEFRDAGLVRANFFTDNPRILAQVRIWVTQSEALARKFILDTASKGKLSENDLDRIIRIAKKKKE
jgi:hypothetical protein